MEMRVFELESYEAPRVVVLSTIVERGFTLSGHIGYEDPDDQWQEGDWREDDDLDW